MHIHGSSAFVDLMGVSELEQMMYDDYYFVKKKRKDVIKKLHHKIKNRFGKTLLENWYDPICYGGIRAKVELAESLFN